MSFFVGRTCTCADTQCIMAGVSRFSLPTRWSSCSVSDLANLRDDTCLFNIPTTMVGSPRCRNGIREGNEVCDCGNMQECSDPCCNAATCQLAAGAQCSAGACCTSQCRFQPYGTQCRGASGECDIAEYCPGDSGQCPMNDHRVDGTPCASNAGYCSGGLCPIHEAQCRALYRK